MTRPHRQRLVVCASCGRTIGGQNPKGGDGSTLVARMHKRPTDISYQCPGSRMPAKEAPR